MDINWGIISIIIGNLCIIPAFIGIAKIKKIPTELKYFVYLLCFYFFVELLGSLFLILRFNIYNAVLTNIFVLFDFIYLYLMLNFWNKKELSKIDFLIISILFFGWIYENILSSSVTVTNSGFRIIYSIIILVKAIEHLSLITSTIRRKLLLNSNFIIASTLILYYSYKSIYESIYYFSLNLNSNEYKNAHLVLLGTNLISYLLYTFAVICMRNKIQLNTSYY
jgi:hypothetical protein